MKSGLTISDSLHGPILVLKLNGYLDGHTYADLEHRFDEQVKQGNKRLVADLKELTYISSAGVGVFIKIQHQLKKQGGNLQLANPSPSVREVFAILGLDSILAIHADLEAGIKAAQNTPQK